MQPALVVLKIKISIHRCNLPSTTIFTYTAAILSKDGVRMWAKQMVWIKAWNIQHYPQRPERINVSGSNHYLIGPSVLRQSQLRTRQIHRLSMAKHLQNHSSIMQGLPSASEKNKLALVQQRYLILCFGHLKCSKGKPCFMQWCSWFFRS